MAIDVKILGPIGATVDGVPVVFGSPKIRLLFGILAHDLQVIQKERLAQLLWHDSEREELRDPYDLIQTYARGIRTALADAVPGGRKLLHTWHGNGYQLLVSPEQVDRHRFALLKAQAEAVEHTRPGTAARLGRRALREWSNPYGLRGGTPLESDETQLEGLVEGLRQDYRLVLLLCIRGELACGRHQQLLPELARLGADPYGAEDKELTQLRMLALARAGRPQDAAAVFDRYREVLGESHGGDADEETRKLKFKILNEDDDVMLDEADYAPYEGEEPAEEVAPEPATRPAGSTFTSIQTGEKARVYQAHSMVFHESPDD